MADAGFSARAVNDVDEDFRRSQQFLVQEHQRQEKRELTYRMAQLQSHDHNHAEGERRYLGRVAVIDSRQRKAEIAMHNRHRSLAGRLEGMTKGGRAKQAEQREALQQRGDHLRIMAHRNLVALQERQSAAKQQDRIFAANYIKMMRSEHDEARQTQAKMHVQTREIRAEVRSQNMKDAAERQLRDQLRELDRKPEGRAHTMSR